MEITCPNHANKLDAQGPKIIKWDTTKRENFIENFDVMEAATIETNWMNFCMKSQNQI